MRERELKRGERESPTLLRRSLPMRERELKLGEVAHEASALQSLPMRERELKLWTSRLKRKPPWVAPHAGA